MSNWVFVVVLTRKIEIYCIFSCYLNINWNWRYPYRWTNCKHLSPTKTRGNCLVLRLVLPHTGYALVPVPSRPSPPFPVLPLHPSLPFPSLSYLPPPFPLKTMVRGSSPGKFWYSRLLWVSFSTLACKRGFANVCVFRSRYIFGVPV